MSQQICSNCGTVGKPKTVTKGSFLIELVLWLSFLFPGFLYSMWRLSSKTKGCRYCGSENMVPLNSPAGEKLQKEFNEKEE